MLRCRARRIRRRSQVVLKLVMWEMTTDPTYGFVRVGFLMELGLGWGCEYLPAFRKEK